MRGEENESTARCGERDAEEKRERKRKRVKDATKANTVSHMETVNKVLK